LSQYALLLYAYSNSGRQRVKRHTHEHIASTNLLSTYFLTVLLELHGGRGRVAAQKPMTSSILPLSRHPDIRCNPNPNTQ